MLNIVIGLIVVTIGATVASWIFDSKTADEKVRQEVLSKELRELQEKFDLEISNNNANFYEISKNNYEKIKAKFLKVTHAVKSVEPNLGDFSYAA